MDVYVYVIGPQDHGPVKIGYSKNVEARLRQLQTGHPEPLMIHAKEGFTTKMGKAVERKFLREMNYQKAEGEWINVSPSDAVRHLEWYAIRYSEEPDHMAKYI